MVTTIKITCDGVFIQSNPYFTNASQIRSQGDNGHDNAMSLLPSDAREDDIPTEQQLPQEETTVSSSPICRPSYHYMYLVRKVPASRSLVTGGRTESAERGRHADTSELLQPAVVDVDFSYPDHRRKELLRTAASVQGLRLIDSVDFANWFLKRRDSPEDSTIKSAFANDHVEYRSFVGSCENLIQKSRSGESAYRETTDTGSSTTKRARRNSTGQIASQLGLCGRGPGGGMNLQSTGQTAAVGKGYLQGATHPPNSLAGECPWFLQNPGAALTNSNPPPPTAPLRQHKRPAPQPGTQFHMHNNNNNTGSQNHPSTIISDLLKPNSIAIHQQTYQSAIANTQHSPKSPCGPVLGSGTNSLHMQQQQPQQQPLMSTSLNSAHLSGHGLSAIASNLPPANIISAQSSVGAMPTNHSHSAMSTSLHSGGSSGHSPALNIGSLAGVTGTGVPSGPSISSSLYNDSGAGTTAAQWPSGNASLSPTTGAPPPVHRKCEVKLNAMPWFHGSISRDEAENLLQPREDGLFLVRESTNFPGDYTLCVCFQGKVEHYRVKYLDNKLTIDDEEYFENLGQLVQHYEKDADGLCTQLVKCLPKMGRQDFCINSKDFLDRGWVIPEADLQLRESIGKGEFGDVMLGILRGDRVAVKVLKDEGAAQKFLTEASVMTTLEHENLVKFIGLVFSSKHIYLVTEYMSKGSLVDYLRSRGRQHITRKDQINFACDTCSGMEYLEVKKVVHRDLAARNVLISESCIAKVADFGLAREECYNLDVGKLPIKWTAPEALKGGRFSNKSDMWSFGILLWEIYSFGRVPYPRIPLADVVKHVEVGYKMEAPEGCPSEIYEMMRQAWDLNPSRRPSFSDLKVKLLQLKSITT